MRIEERTRRAREQPCALPTTRRTERPATCCGSRNWRRHSRDGVRSGCASPPPASTLPMSKAAPLPAHISMEAGACLGIPAYTAYQAVVLTGAEDGSTVLVAGGAGAVGHYAIQLAKKRKATVIA